MKFSKVFALIIESIVVFFLAYMISKDNGISLVIVMLSMIYLKMSETNEIRLTTRKIEK